ncbi:dipeptidase [Cohnella thailandensis]|uniref:Membrane dipeptidase n=1 Tax=Cohnella thailandensis TaxID=557557 RepID=A0A841T2J4_9BACL|nr:dipeptidase [Cohnella thailandensis]MBB6635311.1 membrane dipeptidase [Cohnella thailandensis]MBP1974690.1 membrane dipeptidase [Cohnella thailandensis]
MPRVLDLHCDVLYKLQKDPKLNMHPEGQGKLDVTRARLEEGSVAAQVFAIFVPEDEPMEPQTALHQAELFWSKVLTEPGVKLIRSSADLEEARRTGAMGALLSLEGVDCLRGQWWSLRLLHRLGVRLLGMTWNRANWAADGAMEPRGGGLTKAGRQLVKECESLGILIDVSHLSERGFWELKELATKPFFASHSNAKAILNHPRNLSDEQLRALIEADGLIGVTFVPYFLTKEPVARIDDVLRHVEHICGLGGANHLAFGSDFDGIELYVDGLAHPGQYPDLADALLKRYPESLVNGFLSGNATRYLSDNLPKR